MEKSPACTYENIKTMTNMQNLEITLWLLFNYHKYIYVDHRLVKLCICLMWERNKVN